MSVALVDLVPRLEASLTVPGAPALFSFTSAEEDGWVGALAGAFWNARLAGLFTTYIVDVGGDAISNVDPTGDEFPVELHQVVVLFAALNAIEMRFAGFADTRAKSGEEEFEQKRPVSLLNALLAARRKELEEIKEDLLDDVPGPSSTAVAFIDLALARHDQIAYGEGYWVR
jgi:hypothetical protein